MDRIDLNCDLGEGCGSDAELIPLISSANIACGGHAGTAETMRRTVELAVEHKVAIGAHPGYDDPTDFGRAPQNLTHSELRSVILRQLDALQLVVDKAGGRIVHVKPHGALYNQAAADRGIAASIATTISEWDRSLIVVGLSGSYSVSESAGAGLRTASEAFADRRYDAYGRLIPRNRAEAVITDAAAAANQVLDIVRYGRVRSDEGTMVKIDADTICLHGDGTTAVGTARQIRSALAGAGISINRLDG